MTRLVVNGCSYMESYAIGNGHQELAARLGIGTAESLALAGSCNSRIVRTTLKDSYQNQEKTLYIIGLSFLGRTELPIADTGDPFEGKWISIQNGHNPNHHYNDCWSRKDSEQFIELKLKAELYSIDDYLEQLMYQILSMINDLNSRGHRAVVFRNPDDIYVDRLADPRFTKLRNCVNIIDGLKWGSLEWQHTQGIEFDPRDNQLDVGMRHPMPGAHTPLNNFLFEYIKQNEIHLPVLS